MKLLNLGCGNRYHPEWINLDFVSHTPEVIQRDLTQGIPYPDCYADAVYHSHVLEHFSKQDGDAFIRECYRVLKPKGVLRVVIPDLENIVKNYLKYLDLAASGDTSAQANYDWMMLELYDQCVRNEGGGEMGKYLTQPTVANETFVKGRIGEFYDIVRAHMNDAHGETGFRQAIKNTRFGKILLRAKRFMGTKFSNPYETIGKFRMSGEVHQWMYDRFSLTRLLKNTGFHDIRVCIAGQSAIAHWVDYNLDTDNNGHIVYKADSLYMEAIK